MQAIGPVAARHRKQCRAQHGQIATRTQHHGLDPIGANRQPVCDKVEPTTGPCRQRDIPRQGGQIQTVRPLARVNLQSAGRRAVHNHRVVASRTVHAVASG